MISSNIEANNLESTVEMNFCKIRSTVNVNKEIETNSCLNHPIIDTNRVFYERNKEFNKRDFVQFFGSGHY